MSRTLAGTLVAVLTLLAWVGPAEARLLQTSGNVTLLRIHNVGTKYGPPTDQIDVEVVFWVDRHPGRAFGFQLRNDANRAVRQGMLDLLRDAYTHGHRVYFDYSIDDGKKNGVVIRLWLKK